MKRLKTKNIMAVFLLTLFIVGLLMPLAHATSITSISPTSGPVGTTVTLVGAIDTINGPYEIWFDINGNLARDSGEKVAEGTAVGKDVSDTFVVPNAFKGSHAVWLLDVFAGTTGLAAFTVTTSYFISAVVPSPPLQKQEGDTALILTNVTGGMKDTVYYVNVTVTDPFGGVFWDDVYLTNTTYTGYGYNDTLVYTNGFSTGAHTNYTGTYQMAFNTTLATGSFFIGLTNATQYARFETVNIKTSGWVPGQYVYINITDPTGVIVSSSGNVSLTDGTGSWNWLIPGEAPLGTYTAKVTNATGTAKPIADIQTFNVVGVGILSVTKVVEPLGTIERTQIATMNFTIQYPNATYYTAAQLGTIPVRVYYNTTLVTTISLTSAHFDVGTNTWQVRWTIPKDAVLGTGYNFTIVENSIVDKEGNSGPAATVSSNPFVVLYGVLAVDITDQWTVGTEYNRTATVAMNFTAKFPDLTYYTSADLGTITVGVYKATTSIANITLTAADFDPATNKWTASWVVPWNATLGADYKFTIRANEVIDKFGNKGPTSDVDSNTFEVVVVTLTVPAIYTDSPTYMRGSMVTIYFTATYLDGSPVTTGSAPITLIRPDLTTVDLTATYSATYARFQVSWWLPDYEQLGNWTVKLAAYDLIDGATPYNTGPIADRTTTFEVTERLITVETIYDYLTITVKPILDDILGNVTAIEAKLDNVDYGLSAIKTAISEAQSAIITKLFEIEIKIDGIKGKLDLLVVDADASGVPDFIEEITAIEAKLDLLAEKVILAPSAVKFDFGTETSLCCPEFIHVSPTTAYSPDLGYGWTDTSDLRSRDRGAPPEYTMCDLIFSSEDRTFKVDLPNGNYTVIVTIGDQSYMHDMIEIYAEGDLKATVDLVSAGTFAQRVFIVSVTDGSLDLTLKDAGGVDANWVINALIIQRSWSR